MNSVTEPVAKAARHSGTPRSANEWLDALSSGACDQAQFFQGVADLLQRAPDAGWELLGLVDQYFRRGKISSQAFGTVKTHLQGLMVGKGDGEELSDPMPRMQGEPAARAATPPPIAVTLARHARAGAAARMQASGPHGAAEPAGPEAGTEHLLAPGDLLRGRYLVQGMLGRGGMGIVYAAIDQFRLDRSVDDQKVALKVLHTEIIKRPRLFAELRREFQHLQSLSHPNIVRVHEFDRDGELAFFTMEYLSGALLSRVLAAQESSTLNRSYALAIIRDLGSAIAHAHARGVVHGDLNPGNIFITDNGEVRVLDFGAAHQLHRGPWISEFDNNAHIAVATPGFASCQVLEGEAADARDDVYALACIAYVLLAGRHPFRDKSPLQARTLRLTPDRPRGLGNRPWKALRAGLDFNREHRPSDVGGWLERLDLRSAAPHLPPLISLRTARPRRGRGRIWTQTAAAALCAACGWLAAVNAEHLRTAGAEIGVEWKTLSASLFGAAGPQSPTVLQSVPEGSPPTAGSDHAAVPAAAAGGSMAPRSDVAVATEISPAHGSAEPPVNALSTPAPAAAAAPEAVSQAGYAPHARIELTSDTLEVAPGEPMAQVGVRRSRNLRGDVGFTWWTESGTAKPGRDFVAVNAQVEHIENGQSAVSLVIPVVVDPTRRETRSFYVVIDEPSDNAALGSRTLTMVTLPGSDPQPSADSSQ